MTDYAKLIERLEKVEPDTPGEGVTRYYRNPDGPEAAAALRTLLSRAEAAEAKLAEAMKALEPFSVFAAPLFERNFNRTDVVARVSAADGGVVSITAGNFFDARALKENGNGE